MPSLWDSVDNRVLRWVFDDWGSSLENVVYQFDTRPSEEIPELDGLPGDEFDRSLQRLCEHGLLDGHRSEAMSGNVRWTRLRVTAPGLIVLEEWPDLDRLVSAVGIHELLNALAEAAPEEERGALRKTAGLAGRFGDAVIRATLAQVSGAAGKEAVE